MSHKIRDWHKFQHFKDRRPPWIKLHRTLLDDVEFSELNGEDARYLIYLWLIASEDEHKNGGLPPIKQLAFRLRVTDKRLMDILNRLEHWLIQDDIKVISEGYQDGPSETETETETETQGWRDCFEVYKTQEEEAYKTLIEDEEWIKSREELSPNVDIRLSLKKAHIDFWGCEAGWKHKKKSKTADIDWRSTFTKAIDMNKVYIPRGAAPSSTTPKVRYD